MSTYVGVLVGFILFSGMTVGNESPKRVQNFTLDDYNGAKHSLTDYNSSRAIVLMFIATQCPVSNSYNGRMNELYNDYGKRNVAFIGINSNSEEDAEEIKRHAMEKGFKFPILKDWKNIVADRLGASVTPEIFVLNSHCEILYHGRIDNASREDRVTSKDLRNALNEILDSKAVSVSSTKAFGCTIKKIG